MFYIVFFLQMNVPLYGLLGVVAALLVYIVGIGMIVKLFICLLALILGYDSIVVILYSVYFIMYISKILIYIFYCRIMTCIYRTYGANLDNAVKSEREDLDKKTEKLRQVNRY